MRGAYFGLRAKQGKDFDHDAALKLAKEISDKAHGVYGKQNLPHFARGPTFTAQVARSFYVFKTFSHNYLLTMYDLGFRQKEAKAFAFMAIAPGVLAGAGAFVGAPVLKIIASALGIGGDDPEEWVYDQLDKHLGEHAETFGRYGLFGLAGVSLKGSLEIGITDIPTSVKDILGAPGSMVTDIAYGLGDFYKGDVWKGTERMLPHFAGAAMKSIREGTEGLTTRSGAPVFYGREPLVADTVDSVYRFMSFNPARIARVREKQWHERTYPYKGI